MAEMARLRSLAAGESGSNIKISTEALADQWTTVSKLRFGNKMGAVTARDMQKIE